MRVALHTKVRADRIAEYESRPPRGPRRAHRRDPRRRRHLLDDLAQRHRPLPRPGVRRLRPPARRAGEAPGQRRLAGPHGRAPRRGARLLRRGRGRRPARRMGAAMTVDAHHHVWDLVGPGPGLDHRRRTRPAPPQLHPRRPRARGPRGRRRPPPSSSRRSPSPRRPRSSSPSPPTHDLIAGVVGWTDLTRPDSPTNSPALRELPGGRYLAGIRHQVQGEPDPEWLLRPDVRRGCAPSPPRASSTTWSSCPTSCPAAVKAAAALPELTFVLDHLGKPPVAVGRPATPGPTASARLAALPNTVCKLSGLVTEADPAVLDRGGPAPVRGHGAGRLRPAPLMFGSDWPVCTLAATYGEVLSPARELTGGLDAGERADLFDGAVTRVYGL